MAGEQLSFQDANSLWRDLKKEDELTLAWSVLERIRKDNGAHLVDGLPNERSTLDQLCQQQALLVGKDQELAAATRHDRAVKILRERFLLDDPSMDKDSETWGITGGIYKRKWEDLGRLEDLKHAAEFYRRAARNPDGWRSDGALGSTFMANPEHLATLRKGLPAWNSWRVQHHQIRPDLSSAELSGLNLHAGRFLDTDFRLADLSGTDLSYADLVNTSFAGTNLKDVDLSGADLMSAEFLHSNLIGTDFSKSQVGYSAFGGLDLSEAKGLSSVRHSGPSIIGIDTIYASGGKIPELFLRGAGVPESLITYAKSLVGSAIEFYSLFISYSTADQDFAERLHADLQSKGIRCWFAPHDIQGGRKVHEQIDEAIRLHDKLLVILSPDSMKSTWVETEISKARKREIRDKVRVLFPVRLVPFEALCDWECFDADTGKDSAREIREYFVPDFSNWKNHDSYRLAFDRLVKDLQAPARGREQLNPTI